MTQPMPPMEQHRAESNTMMNRAKEHVLQFTRTYYGPNAFAGLTIEDVYVVWFSKTLQNWKALLSTNIKDGFYYEVTYNGDKREAYLVAYKQTANVVIPDPEEKYLEHSDPFGYAVKPTDTHSGLTPGQYEERLDHVLNRDLDGR